MMQATAIFIDYREVEDLVRKHFGIDYELPCVMESNNDVAYVWQVDGRWEDEEVTPDSWPTEFLDRLAAKGIIPEGRYVIEVSW